MKITYEIELCRCQDVHGDHKRTLADEAGELMVKLSSITKNHDALVAIHALMWLMAILLVESWPRETVIAHIPALLANLDAGIRANLDLDPPLRAEDGPVH
jgi:hypothetical protein